jgi:hypothetical protein
VTGSRPLRPSFSQISSHFWTPCLTVRISALCGALLARLRESSRNARASFSVEKVAKA